MIVSRDRRVGAAHGDQLGDVDALIADPLDVADDVQHRGGEPQVAGDRGLQGEQREHALVHLEVAPVDPVVVGDDELREPQVDGIERVEHAIDLAERHVHATERGALDLAHLLLEVLPALAARHQLNLPVTYSSVRGFAGLLKSVSVAACSMSSPR